MTQHFLDMADGCTVLQHKGCTAVAEMGSSPFPALW
jgi:hypothetical protein